LKNALRHGKSNLSNRSRITRLTTRLKDLAGQSHARWAEENLWHEGVFVNRNKILRVLLGVVIASSIFYAGGVIGYLTGYTDGLNAPVNAFYSVSVADSVRREDSSSALKLLDTQLDANIIYHWSLKNRGRSYFDVMGFGKYDKGFMESVADYRRRLPINESDKGINNAIASVLHQYSTSKKRKNRLSPTNQRQTDKPLR
jgi:hypothetical protein